MSLSLFPLECDGRAAYMETHPHTYGHRGLSLIGLLICNDGLLVGPLLVGAPLPRSQRPMGSNFPGPRTANNEQLQEVPPLFFPWSSSTVGY
jgi:hypothetical protein